MSKPTYTDMKRYAAKVTDAPKYRAASESAVLLEIEEKFRTFELDSQKRYKDTVYRLTPKQVTGPPVRCSSKHTSRTSFW